MSWCNLALTKLSSLESLPFWTTYTVALPDVKNQDKEEKDQMRSLVILN